MACLDNIDKLGLKINAGGSAGVLRSLFVYTYDWMLKVYLEDLQDIADECSCVVVFVSSEGIAIHDIMW